MTSPGKFFAGSASVLTDPEVQVTTIVKAIFDCVITLLSNCGMLLSVTMYKQLYQSSIAMTGI